MKRKRFLVVAVLASLLLWATGCGPGGDKTGGGTPAPSSGGASADSDGLENKLVLGVWGGSWNDMAQKYMFEPFKKQYPNVELVPDLIGSSADILAKMEAQRNNPQMDIVTMTELMTVKAIKAGLVEKLTESDVPELKELYDIARMDPYGPAILLANVGIAYNPKMIKEPPASWNDLLDPKYKGQIALPTFGNTSAVSFLIMAAKMNGGDEKNIDPGFEFLNKLKPNVSQLYTTDADVQARFQRGEIGIAVWWNGPAYAAKKAGVDVEFVTPKEGSPVIRSMINLVKNAPHPNAAKKMIGFYLNKEGQKGMAENIFYGPVNKNVVVSDELKSYMPYGEEAIKKLLSFDWSYVADQLNDWTQRWEALFGK